VVPNLLATRDRHSLHGEAVDLREAGRNALHDQKREVANSGTPPVLVAFGVYDAAMLREFASEHGGGLVERWQLFGGESLFRETAE
jgi:hypothetical protein